MSVFKEGYYTVEQIAKSSERLYSDAADFGAPTIQGDPLWRLVEQTMIEYGVRNTRNIANYETGKAVYQQIELMKVWGDKLIKERFEIGYIQTYDLIGYDGYFTINKIDEYYVSK